MTTEAFTSAGSFQLHLEHDVPMPLGDLDGFGPKTIERLGERGIDDMRDLVMLIPRKYRPCAHFFPGEEMIAARRPAVEFLAPISEVNLPRANSRAPVEVFVDLDGPHIKLLWFNMNRRGFTRQFEVGRWLHVEGEVDYDRGIPTMTHPEFRTLGREPVEPPAPHYSIKPVYPSYEGVRDATLLSGIRTSVEALGPRMVDVVPGHLRELHDLGTVAEAFRVIHLIENFEDIEFFQQQLQRARNRLVYEEFYTLQVSLTERYVEERAEARAPACTERELGRTFVRELPFTLTGDQRAAIATIADELGESRPMRRLLQGDVGSGKTVVALMAAAIAAGSGQQTALMAPTDILARQHMRRAREFFEGLEVTIDLLSASLSAPERREVLERLADGATDLVVGTHALFQDDIHFEELGFVIVDEQHKFGVAQRETLLAKGRDPHLLAMTATPIPRSLAHAVFGDLDLSVIREKPPGRQPVRTEVRPRSRARRVYEYVRDRIDDSGEQAYFVYPMIEANEESARRSVIEEAEKLREEVFADLRVEVLHGRLDGDTKDEVMQRFASGDIDVLCATTVIEVGVDVPNATLMVIENPEVFGLSQLHQLRGRIGRGAASSMCVLLASPRLTQDARERLIAFGQIDDGFELAEIDMKIRGPGLFLGLRQAGAAEFRFGDLIRDADWLETARRDVRRELLGDIGPPPG